MSLPAGIIAIGCPATLAIRQLSVTPPAGSRCVRFFPIAAFTAAPFARFAFPREANGREHGAAGVANLAGEASVIREKLVALLDA